MERQGDFARPEQSNLNYMEPEYYEFKPGNRKLYSNKNGAFQKTREEEMLKNFEDEREHLEQEHNLKIHKLENKRKNYIAFLKLKNRNEAMRLFSKMVRLLREIEKDVDNAVENGISDELFSDSIERQIQQFEEETEYFESFMIRSSYIDADIFEKLSDQVLKMGELVNYSNLRSLCVHYQIACSNNDAERVELYKDDLRNFHLDLQEMADICSDFNV